jgi:hypothetical protein
MSIVGPSSSVTGTNSVAIGFQATSNKADQIVLGNSSSTVIPGGNLILASYSADPTGVAGMIYYNTVSGKLKFYNGNTSLWETITSS